MTREERKIVGVNHGVGQLSKLPRIKNLSPDDLIEVSFKNDEGEWESSSITFGDFIDNIKKYI